MDDAYFESRVICSSATTSVGTAAHTKRYDWKVSLKALILLQEVSQKTGYPEKNESISRDPPSTRSRYAIRFAQDLSPFAAISRLLDYRLLAKRRANSP